MANTVTLLSYANTFGDWVVTTNALVVENNNLAANNYIKPSGTLYLNDPTLGLQVGNNAVIAGQLQVTGIGSSAYVQNNLRVDTQVYFTNTIIGLTNSGQANIGGPLLALGANNGLQVANSATIGGNVIVYQTSTLVGAANVGNTLNVIGATSLQNTLTVAQNASFSANINAAQYVNVIHDVNATDFIASQSITGSSLLINNNAQIGGQLAVTGNFIINGTTVYNTNTFTINANSNVGLTSTFAVNRGVNANAAIRWNEANTYWDLRDVNNPSSYSKILTANLISDSILSTNSNTLASSNSVTILKSYVDANVTSLQNQITANTTSLQNQITANTTSLQNQITANTTSLQNQITANTTSLQNQISANVSYISGVDSTQNTNITAVNNFAQSAYNKANTGSGTFVGTSGIAQSVNGVLSFNSNNGMTIGATGNTLTISSAQDLRTSASPTFAGLTLNGTPTAPTATNGTNTTQIATTAFVLNELGSGGTFGMNISGNAGTATSPASGGSFWTSSNLTNLNQLSNGPGYYSSGSAATFAGVGTTSPLEVSSRNYGGPAIRIRDVSAGVISFYDNYDPDSSIYNYSLVMDGGTFGFFMSGTNSAYDQGSSKASIDSGGNFYAVGNVTAYSDEKLKKNWRSLPVDFITQLSQVKNGIYDRIDENITQVGVSAQSLQKVMPDAIIQNKEGILSVSYGNAALVATVELAKEIVSLKEIIENLYTEIEELKKK
jgi:hypothetical protein